MEGMQRNTAYKVWIADLITSRFTRGQEQFDSGYVEIKGTRISRVNLIGAVVDKVVNDTSAFVTLDDGSGVLRLKTWNETIVLFSEVNIGDFVLVVGKVREYNNSIYVLPEVVRKLDTPSWFKLRKLELVKDYGEVARVESVLEESREQAAEEEEYTVPIVEEKMGAPSGNGRALLLGLIDTLDAGSGADLSEVIKKSGLGESTRTVVFDLIKSGEVFEIEPGKLRVMG